ncbi:MAG: hypothetical protein O7C75_15520 [Verrucomicrobia bacterium]|nr:hypothetical protein [Verrucomicrobiota bacterium]
MCVGLSTTVLHLSAQAQPQLDDPLRHTLEFEGVEREYFVRLPVNYVAEKTFWLAIVVHGGNGNGRDFYLAKDVRLSADELGLDAIVVSPSFSNEDFQASRFPALGEGKFLHRVLDDLHEQYQLRPKILLTGYSRGGQFSHRFAFSNPELVEAVAPFAAGTWTTPNGSLLIESFGKVGNPGTFLSKPENRLLVTERLYDIFSVRVANVAGQTPKSGAKNVPFLVMCGSLDTRFEIAQEFAQSMEFAGYSVETEWPRTPHGSRNKEEFKTEFEKYSKNAVEFFLRVTEEE